MGRGSTGQTLARTRSPGSGAEQRKGGFRTAKEAQSALAQVVAAVSTGEHRHDRRLTVGEWLTTWLARKIEDGQNEAHGGIRPSTAVMYRSYVEGTLIPHLGRFRLGELRHSHVERMLRAPPRRGQGRRDDPAHSRRAQVGTIGSETRTAGL